MKLALQLCWVLNHISAGSYLDYDHGSGDLRSRGPAHGLVIRLGSTQEDPIGIAGGLNLYQFNGNNPVAYTDPFGLCPPCNFGPLSGAIRAAATAARRIASPNPYQAAWANPQMREFMLAAAMGPESFTGGPLGSSPEQSLGRQISSGHALEHLEEFEGLGIKTEQQFSQHIDDVVSKASGDDVRQLSRGRTAYWDRETGTVVIHDPKSADAGTAFRPTGGRAYFDDLK